MSNNRQNRTNRSLLDTERTRAGNEFGGYNETQRQRGDEYYNNARDTRQSVIDRYSNNNNFLPPGMMPNAQGGFNTSGMLERASADFSAPKAGYEEASRTGLINRADYAPALDSYKTMMGGLGASQQEALRGRATAAIPSFYTALKNTMAQRNNVQGGYGPGFDSSMAEIARQQGREAYNASRQAEGDIVDKSNQLAQFGTQGYGDLATRIGGMEQSGRLAGLGGLTNIGSEEAAMSRFNAGQGNQLQSQLLDAYQRGGIENARGMAGINAADIGQYENAMGSRLAGIQARGGLTLNNLGQRSAIQDRGFLDYLPSILGGAGAVFGGMQGAGGNTGFFNRFRRGGGQYQGTYNPQVNG